MPKLSVIDLAMFLLETRERPFNIGPLVLLRPPKGQPKRFADKLVKRMLVHPPGPPFNYKFSLSLTGAPTLEPLDDVDLSRHVHRLTLAGDGSMSDLLAQVCTLHETPLDRSGLLWQFYVIDGLDDGRVALYGKVHHGTIDGRTFVQAVTHWFSTDPADPEVRALWQGVPHAGHARDKLETELGEAGRAIGGPLRKSLAAASGMVSSTASLYRMLAGQGLRSLGLNDKAMALPFIRVPRVLSGKPSSKRNYAFTTLPLGEIKALGKNAGATVNDMLLAVLDGALDRYLADKPRRARKPLVVDMPVALAGASGGNQIAVLQLAMGLPGMTLRERLDAIRAETSRVKAAAKNIPAETVMLYTTLVHSLPLLLERVGINRPLLVSNLLFSNPFGIDKRSYLMGAEVELALPMSVVAAGQMLNVTVVTLADNLQIGFLGIPGAVDRIDRLAECTREAFDELKREFGAAEVPSPAKATTPRAARPKAPTRGTAAKPATKARPAAKRGARKAAAP